MNYKKNFVINMAVLCKIKLGTEIGDMWTQCTLMSLRRVASLRFCQERQRYLESATTYNAVCVQF